MCECYSEAIKLGGDKMKDSEKQALARWVRQEIANGKSMTATVKKLNKLGFKQGTIRAYYKAFSSS